MQNPLIAIKNIQNNQIKRSIFLKKYTAYQLTNIFIYYKLDPISDKESSQCLLKMLGM